MTNEYKIQRLKNSITGDHYIVLRKNVQKWFGPFVDRVQWLPEHTVLMKGYSDLKFDTIEDAKRYIQQKGGDVSE